MDVDGLRAAFEAQGVMASCAERIGAKLRGYRFDPEVRKRDFVIRIGLTTQAPKKAPTEFAFRTGIEVGEQEVVDSFIAAFNRHNGIG